MWSNSHDTKLNNYEDANSEEEEEGRGENDQVSWTAILRDYTAATGIHFE